MKKKLANMGKRMVFVKRIKTIDRHIDGTIPWQNILIEDYYFHTEAQITLIRQEHCMKKQGYSDTRQWVNWTCPELGGGSCGISYWLYLAEHRPSHDTKTKFNQNE